MSSSKFGRVLLPFLTVICLNSFAQSGADQKKQDNYAQLKNLVDSKKFRFHALSATAQKGRTVQLTSGYYLKLNSDSLGVDLPYYGRAYSSDYGSTDVSVQFKTNQFTYSADSVKKGGWDITIVPKNQPKANKIFISITASGYSTVQITSNSRQAVSYYGNITAYDTR